MSHCYVCLKWGTKYSSEYVNKLASMIRKWDRPDVDIFCYTDDPTDIDPTIRIIPTSGDYQAWWFKLPLLIEPTLQPYNVKILFDLDVIIHNDISNLHTFAGPELTLCSSAWKNPAVLLDVHEKNTMYNSSIMVWKDAEYVWNAFQQDPEKFMSIYKGIDRFLWNENVAIATLPPNIVYSYRRGATLTDNRPFVKRDDYAVALFHGSPKQSDLLHDPFIMEYWNEL